MTDDEEAVDAAIEEMFDRIPPLAWLRGFARESAKEECRKIILHAVEPLVAGRGLELWH